MKLKLFSIVFLASTILVIAQTKDSISFKNGIQNPSLVPTHHFGIFSSRPNTNFKLRPNNQINFHFDYSSANIFHPYLEAYFPIDPETRQALSEVPWYFRNFTFVNQETTPAEYMNIVVDAVIKEFRLGFSIPLNQNHEISFNVRSYLITNGKLPFSLISSDESIEWFHSNIAGGEDPFGRRFYGLNQVNFSYEDRNGNQLSFSSNDFFVGGIEIHHHYYPSFEKLKQKNIHLNFGSHLGLNTSTYNPSMDFGISFNGVKEFNLKKQYKMSAALGFNILRKNTINFDEVMDFGNNDFIGTLEANFETYKFTKNGNFNSIGLHYQIQTPYNQRKEKDYYKLIGDWQSINAGWHNGVSTLYNYLSSWSLIYTYGTPKIRFSAYLKQDFTVHNAPDLEAGVSARIPIKLNKSS